MSDFLNRDQRLLHVAPAVRWLGEHNGWLLISVTLLSFCTKTLFLVPLGAMALLGLWRCLRQPWQLRYDPSLRLLGALFCAVWIPQLLALPDAVNFERSAFKACAYLCYFFAAVYMLHALRQPRCLERVGKAAFVIVTFWVADALLQYAAGVNLLGYPYKPGQLSGMFHPKIRLGHMLALLLPVYLEWLRLLSFGGRQRVGWWLLAIPLLAALLLSGKRVAWFMAILGLAGYLGYLLGTRRRLPWRWLAPAAILVITVFAVLVQTHAPLARRVQATLGLMSADSTEVDRATAHRLSIWDTALRMARAHWINGVGVRGFRYAYAEHAAPGNYFLQKGRVGQTHPHLAVLEVAAETGGIGLLGYLLFWLLLLRNAAACFQSSPEGFPWYLAAAIAWLPINAHLAFYGSYWSSVSWWILLVALAAGRRNRAVPERCPS